MHDLTKQQAIVITGFTGKLACNFSDFHKDVELRMGHPVFTHQFSNRDFADKVKELYREDFINLLDAPSA